MKMIHILILSTILAVLASCSRPKHSAQVNRVTEVQRANAPVDGEANAGKHKTIEIGQSSETEQQGSQANQGSDDDDKDD